ncbi:Protein FAR1-RELATED SEQUENCE 8 [Striga hermonthica]|uniref:Protein FAR1-RELATED SEQUENCE n=1 Tax=Striga hermonthica TaxID=68872 RepID=A0A9N7MZ93_STRHE|nr:Protein FAR1-RELATED SEQUENCE 8 [Striga hermonthica]
MADDTVPSPADEGFSPDSGFEITVEEGSNNSQERLGHERVDGLGIQTDELDQIENIGIENGKDQILVDLENENEHAPDSTTSISAKSRDAEYNNNSYNINQCAQEKSYPPPVEGMEFESYDDAYNYYNCYAKEVGFGIRVKSSWTKRNSKEKRGAVLCCNCEGFKTPKETSMKRKETRTGCLAMLRLRLLESSRWRLDEVKLQHNHLFDHQRAQSSRSHKKMEIGTKRKPEPAAHLEVCTIKLYRAPHVDCASHDEREPDGHVDKSKRLKFKNRDLKALHGFFRRAQLADPNFFYIMDFSDEGYLRNVFWMDSRSRAAYRYFGDVVLVDAERVSSEHDGIIPVLSFSGLNHHCQPVLLGCGLLADGSIETYVWLMRTWIACMSGRAPQTIITTGQCTALWGAISEVFPRAVHRLCPSLVVQIIYEKLGVLGASELFQTVLNRNVYESNKVEEFEMGWEEMVQHFALGDHEWLERLYKDRERWVPVYTKRSTFFAGAFIFQPGEFTNMSYFHGYLRDGMTWEDFFTCYELLQQKTIVKEALADSESREFTPVLLTTCSYEFPVSQLYTKEIFLKFQEEVVLMSRCFSVTQIQANGHVLTYIVKEQNTEVHPNEAKNFEVVYDKVGTEVRCICGCFNMRGYLCRHALCVLNYNGIEEIPKQYVLSRWRKDTKRIYYPDLGSNGIDISNPVHWYQHLYRRAMQVVSEGLVSRDHRMVACQAFKDSLDKVRLAGSQDR